MREKGVSSIVVIAVVIVIIAAVGVGSYSLLKGGGAGLSSLSVYTGSQSWAIPSEYQENLPAGAGVEVAGYTVSGVSVQAVLDWYRGQMTGWTLESEPVMSMGGVEIGGLIYMKGDDGAGIIAMSGMGLPGTCYILATGPWSAFGGLEGQGTPPSWMPTVTAQGSGNTVTLTIRNEGGDDVNISDLQVQGSNSTGTMVTATLNPSSGTLSTDETITATYTYGGAITTRKIITVYIIHKPSQQKFFSSDYVIVEPSAGAPPPSAVLTVTAESIVSIDVKITITHEGGDDFIATDLQVRASDSIGVMQFVTMTISGGATTFAVGGTATGEYDYGADPLGKAITVYVIYKPTGQKIFSSSTVIVQAGIFDGTYNCNVTTVTPIGTTSLPGTFTVNNGFVYDPGYTFTGTINANGYFTGTTIVSPGSPPMTMTGQFSSTGNFTIYGSSGNTSQTVVAHKVS